MGSDILRIIVLVWIAIFVSGIRKYSKNGNVSAVKMATIVQ